jgi:hypothetical protein
MPIYIYKYTHIYILKKEMPRYCEKYNFLKVMEEKNRKSSYPLHVNVI